MYELEYVKKRKRRRAVLLVGGVSTAVVSTLSIVAFLGRFVGTFSVSLDTGNVGLSLSREQAFTDPTSFLKVDALPEFQEYTYSDFKKIGDEAIDSEQSDLNLGATAYNDDGTIKNLNFFKYTFYIKNTGDEPCMYNFSLKIVESTPSSDGRYLDDTIRFMLYDNESEGEHNKTVYAKRSNIPHLNEEGEIDYRSPISVSKEESSKDYPFEGYAETFESSNEVTNFSVDNFAVGEIRRYTLVYWLEGFSSDNNNTAPKGARIKLGVEINGYEIK